MNSPELQQAIDLIKSGENKKARDLLLQIIRTDPLNELAWMWLVQTADNDSERIAVLEHYLKINPKSAVATHALQTLRLQQEVRPTSVPTSPSPTSTNSIPQSEGITSTNPPEPRQSDEPLDRIASVLGENRPISSTPKNTGEGGEMVWVFSDRVSEPSSSTQKFAIKPDVSSTIEPTQKKPPEKAKDQPDGLDQLRQQLVQESEKIGTKSQKVDQSRTGKDQTQQKPRKTVQTILRAIIIGGIVITLLAIATIAVMVLTGRIQLPSLPGSQSPALGTVAALENEKAVLETQAAMGTPSQNIGAAGSIPIPAPLYYLSERSVIRQVWRLETDGSTLTQITHSSQPVNDFDVSLKDSSIAYISSNKLYIANADGSNARMVIRGEDIPTDSSTTDLTKLIQSPRWSPDGGRIAYSLNGLQLLTVADGKGQPFSTNLVGTPGSTPNTPTLSVPLTWSPDGSRLLVKERFENCSQLALYPLDGSGGIAGLAPGASTVSWSKDGKTLFASAPTSNCACGGGPGLWRIDVASGTQEKLLDIEAREDQIYVGWPYPADNNQIVFFIGKWTGKRCTELMPDDLPMQLAVSGLNDLSIRDNLRAEPWKISEALWAPDLSVVAIQNQEDGELFLLKSDKSPAVRVGSRGNHFRWGSIPPERLNPSAALVPLPSSTPIAPIEFWRIALNADDLSGDYQLINQRQTLNIQDINDSFEVTYEANTPPTRRTFTHELVDFINPEAAASYYQKLKQENLPDPFTLSEVIGDESSASVIMQNGQNIYTFRLVWRSHTTVSTLTLVVTGDTAISPEEMISLTKTIQQRIRTYLQ
jgi:hypothetical protein